MTVKKGKTGTKGAKQIVEENVSTLKFYKRMIAVAAAVHFIVTKCFFEFTALTISLALFSGIVYIWSYQFMAYIARASYGENGQLLDSGTDLNMEGGIAEHVKDLIILTSGVQVLSLASNYFWFLWLLVPIRACWILWQHVLAPWFFAPGQEQQEVSEKEQKKLKKKMARRY